MYRVCYIRCRLLLKREMTQLSAAGSFVVKRNEQLLHTVNNIAFTILVCYQSVSTKLTSSQRINGPVKFSMEQSGVCSA